MHAETMLAYTHEEPRRLRGRRVDKGPYYVLHAAGTGSWNDHYALCKVL